MINEFICNGFFVKDPEVRRTSGGTQLVTFTFGWNSSSFENKKTLYLKCYVWGKLIDKVIKWGRKGAKCIIHGQLTTYKWERKDGTKVYEICINPLKSIDFDYRGKYYANDSEERPYGADFANPNVQTDNEWAEIETGYEDGEHTGLDDELANLPF